LVFTSSGHKQVDYWRSRPSLSRLGTGTVRAQTVAELGLRTTRPHLKFL